MLKRPEKAGFTLVEVLLSLAITAALLAAVAAAVKGSLDSYTENEKIAAGAQAARHVLNRLMQDIRTADAVDASALGVTIIPPAETGVSLITYDCPGDGTLRCNKTYAAGGEEDTVLLGGNGRFTVDQFTAYAQMAQDGEGEWFTARVTLRLEFTVDDRTTAITTSAAPRRNQDY